MARVMAEQVGAWLAQQRDVPLPDGRSGWVECQVELVERWRPGAPTASFRLAVQLRALNGQNLPVAVRFWSADAAAEAPACCELRLDQPLLLQVVHIPKPWGQEIWYTGVEERGVCGFQGEGGAIAPLPWLLETLAPLVSGGHRELVLLKILDPRPEPVWGDLYFELHEEKREVYVVTRVDPQAWPDGAGAIRFGFDPAVVAQYEDEAAFKRAYRDSVAAYEGVRRDIDRLLDDCRTRAGVGLADALAPEQLQQWLAEVPGELLSRERDRRRAMDAFTRSRPLRVGDVVKVPCLTPHALQHGVRTVEFQTPVYERKILSFAQKVLTQGHWDTAEAVALMQVRTPPEGTFETVLQQPGVLAERIVDFADFQVQRWRIAAGGRHSMPLAGSYALVMVVEGEAQLGQLALGPEQACLVPTTLGAVEVHNPAGQAVTLLVAVPAE